jgi:CheY-like chemotaxis protein
VKVAHELLQLGDRRLQCLTSPGRGRPRCREVRGVGDRIETPQRKNQALHRTVVQGTSDILERLPGHAVQTKAVVDETVPFSVVIVDDTGDIRALVRATVDRRSDLCFAGEAEGMTEAIGLVERTRPDVVIVDRSMPDPPTPGNLDALRRAAPGVVLALLSASAPATVDVALRDAVDVCLLKSGRLDATFDQLVALATERPRP